LNELDAEIGLGRLDTLGPNQVDAIFDLRKEHFAVLGV
jgi:hypothetical protein